MKTARSIALMLAATLVTFAAPAPAKADVDVSFGFFYSNLEPHGSWLVSAQYGRVWQPNVYARGWNPYHDGHWVYSDCGWVWVSDYAWGAVPYHYGTWVIEPGYGWVWVPGTTWAPSWVVFRTGPDYIGWAPVPPSFSIGASFYAADDPDLYVFVGAGDFLAPRVRTRVIPVERTRTVIRHTTIVNRITIDNDVVVNRGPDIQVVERATGKKVRATSIESVRRVAPSGGFSRADLRVREGGGGVRAAWPVSKDEPIPDVKRGPAKQERRKGDQARGPVAYEGGRSATIDQQRNYRMEQRGGADREAMARQQQQAEQRMKSERQAERQKQVREQQRADAQKKARAEQQAKADKKKAAEKKEGKR